MRRRRWPPVHRERQEVAHRNALRLLRLVNTLLDFSRIEAGRIDASYEPTDLAAFTAELASVFRSAIEKAGLELVVDCDPLPEPVYVDRDMWEKIVLNLLSNAFKFTFEGGSRCDCAAHGDRVELRVADTGVGIPEAELPRMFERFHRVKHSRARTHEGTGIGLALVQELARLHGGDVTVASQEGRGTTFTVTHSHRDIAPAGRTDRGRASAGVDERRRDPVRRRSAALAARGGRVDRPRAGARSRSRMPADPGVGDGSRVSWSPTTTPTCATISAAFSASTIASKSSATAAPRSIGFAAALPISCSPT